MREGANNFPYFVKYIFSQSYDNFIHGEFVDEISDWMQSNPRTMRVSAKYHFKSTSLYAHFMWLLLKMRYDDKPRECHFFSYQAELAGYHVGSKSNKDSIKALIRRNPYFHEVVDNKIYAETVIDYTWDGVSNITLTPHGLLTFKRGLHCNGAVYVDDALQDPAEKLNPKVIYRINDIFYSQVIDIPDDGVPLHVVGTAQTRDDFYFDERSKHEFNIRINPAVTDAKVDKDGWLLGGTPLWKEWLDLEKLQHRQRVRGIKVFSQEYMCNPVYSADSFFKREQLDSLVKQKNVHQYEASTDEDVIAGFDIGKHAHPSHLAVYAVKGDNWRQLLSKWFDRVNYTDQVDYIKEMIEALDIDTVYYDATRGELEALEELGELPVEFEPVIFSRRSKHALATQFEIRVEKNRITFVADDRQISQIVAVTNDLDAIQSKEGHGDSFWSNALCFKELTEDTADMVILNTQD